MSSHRPETNVEYEMSLEEAPTIVPPCWDSKSAQGTEVGRDSQPHEFRGFMPVQPPPRRLIVKL